MIPQLPAPYDAMSPQERAYWRSQSLALVLRTLPRPAETGVVVACLARVLGTTDTAKLAQDIIRLAPEHPHATHDGKTFIRFKKQCRGWRWHPEPQGSPLDQAALLGAAPTRAQLEAAESVLEPQGPACWLCGVHPGDTASDGLCEPCRTKSEEGD